MDGLLSDLLTYSRVATDRRPFLPVHLDELVVDVLRDYELAIREMNAEVEVQAAVTLEADAHQLRHLLTNLIGNAFKYRRVDVQPCLYISARVVDIDDTAQEDMVSPICRITVGDNGIGFEETYRKRIFQPFERLHGMTSIPGTGMGLAICQRIVERHKGRIWAESKPGEGSCFISLNCLFVKKRRRNKSG